MNIVIQIQESKVIPISQNSKYEGTNIIPEKQVDAPKLPEFKLPESKLPESRPSQIQYAHRLVYPVVIGHGMNGIGGFLPMGYVRF